MFVSQGSALRVLFGVALGLGLLVSSGCAWVKLSDQGRRVKVVDSHQVGHCRRIGQTTSVSKAEIGFIDREPRKITQELEYLARNNAVDLGGNIIVPLGDREGGRRQYAVYDCPR